ncbi:hypothetical protein [Sphingobacterium athyrii]|uniref:Uncharacterized protein n=1 Tax=Sphingobacterium athyrii TaxID=2152717 RepID=A0A363NM91_9SPHI|nr:hypothetical protein [Sphingobacterium athyrii]PUV21894.1 hypothetical protein DCO56_23425 [Sphingobacterium athyrii]
MFIENNRLFVESIFNGEFYKTSLFKQYGIARGNLKPQPSKNYQLKLNVMSQEKKLTNEELKENIKKTVLEQLDEQLTEEKLSSIDQEKLEGGFASLSGADKGDQTTNIVCW